MQLVAKAKDESPIRTNVFEERARKHLVEWAEIAGYGLTELADDAGIPQANLARYMNGKSPLPIDAQAALARVLGRDPGDFLLVDPPAQRTRQQLLAEIPIVAKGRDGFVWTEDDLADYDEFMRRVQARRSKKAKSSK